VHVPEPGPPASSHRRAALVALVVAFAGALALAQTLPDAELPVLHPEALALVCPERTWTTPPSAAQLASAAARDAYRAMLPAYLARLPRDPDPVLWMPVDGVRVAQVADTWGAPRGGGRDHEGQDVFAPRGTPVRSATYGIVFEVSDRFRGGRGVMVLGPGGVRTFYTHLEAYADGLREGMPVTPETVLGYVGTAGNAAGTPPHLHFGAYAFDPQTCRHRAFDPLPLLVDRTEEARRP
jgi:murein DD-endopeptidase MepM/ murein hydrolase activator NlpD